MNKLILKLRDKKIAIVTHRSLMPCIPGDDLKKFLLHNGCGELLYITHPLLLLKESYKLTSEVEYYQSSKLLKKSSAFHWTLQEFMLYTKDIIYTISWTLKTNKTYDLYVGMNGLNALAGIILKKFGRVKKVIYYTIDLYPDRFGNKFVNWLYHKIDRFCVTKSDETWNVSPYLEDYRRNNWGQNLDLSRQFTVPIGIWFDEMDRVANSKIKKEKIVYVGHLKDFYGVDLAINALPFVKEKVPGAYLEIIGGGEQQEELENLARKIKVEKSVKFFGWKKKKDAEKIISDGAVGLAPFNINIIDEKVKNGDPAKIKDYLALGIPVVMTNASLNAKAISDAKCGIVINEYNPKLYAEAIIKLLSDKKTREEYRKNAYKFIEKFDWNNLFTTNLSRILSL